MAVGTLALIKSYFSLLAGPLSGSSVLMARPLKNNFFCGFPYLKQCNNFFLTTKTLIINNLYEVDNPPPSKPLGDTALNMQVFFNVLPEDYDMIQKFPAQVHLWVWCFSLKATALWYFIPSTYKRLPDNSQFAFGNAIASEKKIYNSKFWNSFTKIIIKLNLGEINDFKVCLETTILQIHNTNEI